MSTLQELIAQREEIEKQISNLRQAEKRSAIDKVRELIAEFELAQDDIFGTSRGPKKVKAPGTKAKVAAKYRDPVSGKEWSGRGISPKWLHGQDKEKFLIVR